MCSNAECGSRWGLDPRSLRVAKPPRLIATTGWARLVASNRCGSVSTPFAGLGSSPRGQPHPRSRLTTKEKGEHEGGERIDPGSKQKEGSGQIQS